MIGFLSGTPKIIDDVFLLVTGGVGYEVAVTPQLKARAQSSQQLELFIYTHVKEDTLALFGFTSLAERSLFLMLLALSGIGPSTALAIVAAGQPQIVEAVQNADTSFFTGIPRVGKKMAQKIIIELGSKLGQLEALNIGPESTQFTQLKDALLALGFAERDIDQLRKHDQLDIEHQPVEVSLKTALQLLSS